MEFSMIAAGCLLLVILPLIGLGMGLLFGSKALAILCALVGFTMAAAVCCTAAYALMKARHRS
jgi:hypothetical protein